MNLGLDEIDFIKQINGDIESVQAFADFLGFSTEKVESMRNTFKNNTILRILRPKQMDGIFGYAGYSDKLNEDTRVNQFKGLFEEVYEAEVENGETSSEVDFLIVVGRGRIVIFNSADYRQRLDLNVFKLEKPDSKYLKKFRSLQSDNIYEYYRRDEVFGDTELSEEFKSELFKFSINDDTSFTLRTKVLRGEILKYILGNNDAKSIIKKAFFNNDAIIDYGNERQREVLTAITDTLVLRQILVRILESRFGYDASSAAKVIKKVGLGNTLTIDEEIDSGLKLDEDQLKKIESSTQLSLFEMDIIDKNDSTLSQAREDVNQYRVNGGDLYTGDVAQAATNIENTLTAEQWAKLWHFTSSKNFDFDLADVTPSTIGEQYEQTMSNELEKDPNGEWTFNKNNFEQKSKGAFYTQQKITDYILEISLGKKLGEIEDKIISANSLTSKKKILQSVLKMKFADITSGGGTFLAGAVRYLGSWYNNLMNKADIFAIAKSIHNMKDVVTFQKYAVRNMIYGIDIDLKALIVSSFALSLESLGDNSEKLPDLLGKTLIHQNSLISLVPEAKKEAWFKLWKDEIAELMLERKKYLAGNKNAFFDKKNTLSKSVIDNTIEWLKNEKTFKKVSKKQIINEINNNRLEILEFNIPEVFFDETGKRVGGFDVVFGNPPYIQLQKAKDKGGFTTLEKNIYRQVGDFKVYESKSDIYALYFERGINLLKDNGYLSFVTSNKFLRSGYGERLRNYLLNFANPLELVNLGNGMFGAQVDTSILLLKNSEFTNTFNAVDLAKRSKDPDYRLKNMSDFIEQHKLLQTYNIDDPWAVLSVTEQNIKKKIEIAGTKLTDWNVVINYGIKTGLNEAFIIDNETKNLLIENDPKSAEIIRPILRGQDIEKNEINFSDKYLITTHNGYVDSLGQYHNAVNIDDYPEVKKWLQSEKWNSKPELGTAIQRLNKRSDKGNTPYNLRDTKYMDDFSKPKIFWSDISLEPNFVKTDKNILINNTAYMITEFPRGLVRFLNSAVIKWYFPKIASDLGNGVRYYKQFVQKIPVPEDTEMLKDILKTENEMEIDSIIFKYLNLSSMEIDCIYGN